MFLCLSVQIGGYNTALILIFESPSDLAKFLALVPFLGTQKCMFPGCAGQWKSLGCQGLSLSGSLSETWDHSVNSVRLSEARFYIQLIFLLWGPNAPPELYKRLRSNSSMIGALSFIWESCCSLFPCTQALLTDRAARQFSSVCAGSASSH